MSPLTVTPRTTRLQRWLLVGISSLVALTAVELILRHTVYAFQQTIDSNSANPRLGYEMQRGFKGIWHTDQGGTYPVRINALGFRGDEVAKAKPADLFRLVLIGDSQVFGAGLAEDQTLAHHLRAALEGQIPGRRVEVLNLGVAGYNTLQESEWILQGALPLQPDLVLWVYFINDLDELDYQPSVLPHCEVPAHPYERVDAWLRRNLKLYRLVVHRTRYSTSRDTVFDPKGLAQRCFRHSVSRAARAARARGVPLQLVFLPYLAWPRSNPYLEPDESHHVRSVAETEGLVYHDLRECFNGVAADSIVISPEDRHLNDAGNARLAAWLAARVFGVGEVPPPPPVDPPGRFRTAGSESRQND